MYQGSSQSRATAMRELIDKCVNLSQASVIHLLEHT